VIVLLVDIDKIVYHHCLKLSFHKMLLRKNYIIMLKNNFITLTEC